MLQRLLSELVKMESLDQAMVVDDRGRLLASVGSQGKLPPTQTVVSMASAALSASQHTALGDLHEVWFEGCLLYTSPSPRDKRQSRMPSSA